MKNFLQNQTFIVMGVANKRSIAWGIAQTLHEAGANLVFTYQGERLKQEVEKLVGEWENTSPLLVECDVTSDESITNAFQKIGNQYPVIHGLAHCIAFANKEDLQGSFLDTSREGYLLSQDISAYSLIAVTRAVKPLMIEGGSIVTLTYLGGERVVQNYNLMGISKAALDANIKYLANDVGVEGIRVNGISAGPIRTLAAKGVAGFNTILSKIEESAPLRRTVNTQDVGNTALYLLSHLSSGVTGEIIHVDAGYHILGL